MTTWTPMASELVTDRLTLGPWRAADADAYREMVVERDSRFATAPRDGTPSRADVLASVERQQQALTDTGIALLVVRVHEVFAGYCGLIVGRSSIDEPEIGYELLRRFHGNGYATEAARAVVTAAADTGRSRLWATLRDWNAASFRVLDKIGFERTDRITTDEHGAIVWCTRAL
jgi:RimJ/RimL family protein N-acetyltransferase